MKIFAIYVNKFGIIEAVKRGWSWPAFFFWWIWAFIKQLWVYGSTCLLGVILLNLMSRELIYRPIKNADFALFIIALIFGALFGINGNKMVENRLKSKGYNFNTLVIAKNIEEAKNKYAKDQQAN